MTDCTSQTRPGLTAFTADAPLLLLTDFPPDLRGGGAVNLRSLLTPDDVRRMVWVTLSPFRAANSDRIVSLARGPRSPLRDATTRARELRSMVQEVAQSYRAAGAWAIAHGACVRVVPGLLDAGLPLHVTVNDDPAWGYALLTRRYLPAAPLLAHDLGRCLRGAKSVDVVSDAMAARYRTNYGVESIIVNRGFDGPVEPSPPYDPRRGLTVAVLGSTYGLRELSVLADALALVSERLNLVVRLTLIGKVDEEGIRRLCSPSVELEFAGHLDEPAGVQKLRAAFLLYHCYPFSRRGKVLRTTSFPTKLSTYAMAARPLLLHTPTDSSVGFLSARQPYATLWSTMDPEDGAHSISQLWTEGQAAQSFDRDAEELRAACFDLSRNRALLFDKLNSLRSASAR